MQLGGEGAPTLARDTVFSLITIVCNGVVGLLRADRRLALSRAGLQRRGRWAYLIVLASRAALRAARRDQSQTSVNLALGATLAAIGLTIPVVAAVNVWMGQSLIPGLSSSNVALLAVAMFVSLITFGGGGANALYGAMHLVLFAAFLLLAFEP